MNNLIKFDPFEEIRALQKQFFGEDWTTPIKGVHMPTTDVYTDGDKQLIVEVHLPNFEDKDIDVHVEEGSLVIRADKHEKEEDKNKKYVIRESSSSFYRRIVLPKIANSDAIEAKMKDGILTVTVPFNELPVPKKITIKK